MSRSAINDPGSPGELAWIETEKLTVKGAYQRDAKSRKSISLIKAIAKSFSWSQFQPLQVAKTGDGIFTIIDGQHRLLAVRKRGGICKLPCYIINASSTKDEAHDFVGINVKRLAMTPLSLYHAELEAGDELALQVKSVLADCSLQIPRSNPPKGLKPGQVVCVSRLKSVIKRIGEASLRNSLIALVEAADGGSEYLRASIIDGVANFYACSERKVEFDPDRLIEVISGKMADEWMETAKAWRLFNNGGPSGVVIRDIILIDYNKGLRKANKLEFLK